MNRQIIIFLIIGFFLSGCAVTEPFKSFLGISTKALENAKSQGISKVYDCEKDACFEKTLAVLKNMKTYIHIKNKEKGIITAMNFRKKDNSEEPDETDTTELGIFFEKQDINKTKITITSLSTVLLNEYAQKIFDNIDKELEKK